MTISQIPADLPLVTVVGSDFAFTVTVLENGAPYSFSGATVNVRIFNMDGTLNAVTFTTAVESNVLTLSLTDANTTALGADSFRYALNVTKSNDTTPWLAGVLTVNPAGFAGSSSTTANLSIVSGPTTTISLAAGFGVIPDAEAVAFTASDPLTETNVQDALTELADAVAPRIPTVKSSVYIEDSAVATLVDQNVAAKVLGTFLAGPACQNCTYNGNRITYIGTRNTRVLAVASVDIDGPNNQTYIVQLRKNGNAVDGLRTKVRKTTAVASGSIVGHIPLEENDFVELWITNTTSGDDPVVSDATFALMN